MPISYNFLALRMAYLAKINEAKRFTISEKSLKEFAHSKVLSISYLYNLKTSLEELGYFFDSLEKGGYGLFPIQSLKNAPDLVIPAKLKKQFEGYNEAELRKEYYEEDEEQKAVEYPITIVEPNIKASLWDELIAAAVDKNPALYGALAKKLGLKHHKKLEKPLKELAIYCTQNGMPRLDYLVTKQSTGLPPGINSEDEVDYKAVKEKIDQYDWTIVSNPFADKVEPSVAHEKLDEQVADSADKATNYSQVEQIDRLHKYDVMTLLKERMKRIKTEEKTIHTTQPDTASPNYNNASTEDHNSKNDDTESYKQDDQSIEKPVTETDNSKATDFSGTGGSNLPSLHEDEQKEEFSYSEIIKKMKEELSKTRQSR